MKNRIPFLTISIVSWNVCGLLLDCLRSIYSTKCNFKIEVIVVDNHSQDNSAARVRENYPQVKVIENNDNYGFAAATNQALVLSQSKYFLILNPDTILTENALQEMVDFMEENPQAGAVGPKMIYGDGRLQMTYIGWKVSPYSVLADYLGVKIFGQDPLSKVVPEKPIIVSDLMGACLLLRKAAIDEIGGMDENFFLVYEEADWLRRLQKAGWSVWYLPNVTITHFCGQSSKYIGAQGLIETMLSLKYYLRKHYGCLTAFMTATILFIVHSWWLLKTEIKGVLKVKGQEYYYRISRFKHILLGLLIQRKLKNYPKITQILNRGVTIVILTWNNRVILQECLNSLEKSNQRNNGFIEILVVDNGSTDGTKEFIAKNYPQIKVVALDENMGFGPAINLGVEQAQSPLVFLMNDDVTVEPDFLEPLINHFSDPLVFAVAPKMVLENNRGGGRTLAKFYHGMLNLEALEDNIRYNLFVGGGAGLFRRDYFLALGGFDLIYRSIYYEDVDICYRAWKRGWKLLYESRSIIYHKQGTIMNKRFPKDYVRDIGRKNMLLFHWKNITDADWLFMHFIFLFLTILKKILMLDFRGLHYIYLALRQFKGIPARRRQERAYSKLRDKQVVSLVRNGA